MLGDGLEALKLGVFVLHGVICGAVDMLLVLGGRCVLHLLLMGGILRREVHLLVVWRSTLSVRIDQLLNAAIRFFDLVDLAVWVEVRGRVLCHLLVGALAVNQSLLLGLGRLDTGWVDYGGLGSGHNSLVNGLLLVLGSGHHWRHVG